MTDAPLTPRFLPDSVETFRQVLRVRELMSRRLAADPHAAPEVRAGWQDVHDKIDVPTLTAWGLDPLTDPHDSAGTAGARNILGTPLDRDWIVDHVDEVTGVPTFKFLVYNALVTRGPCQRGELHDRVRAVRPDASDSAIDRAMQYLYAQGMISRTGNASSYLYHPTSHQTGESFNGTG